jgi:tetratricopeptide (TPR) repeat protein
MMSILLEFLFVFSVFSVSYLEQGEELFLQNKPQEAKALFEKALAEEPQNEKIYLYLGIVYEQLEQNEEAISIMEKGLEYSSNYRPLFYFNMGNNYLVRKQHEEAAAMYTNAIEENEDYARAYLNRANVQVTIGDYEAAIADYRLFLSLEPGTSQKQQIEKMIDTLTQLLEEERRRIAEEKRRKEEEEQRKLEEERRRKEEEERLAKERAARQKALLDSVLQSLDSASTETTNLSAESEDVENFEDDLDIED